MNDILLSAPSIVIGLFVYAVVVARFKSFSGYAGVLALALIVIPVVIRTTENMLLLVPASLREAAYALGTQVARHHHGHFARCPRWRDHRVLLAVARIAGETAPCCLLPSTTSSGMLTCQTPWPACRSRFLNLR